MSFEFTKDELERLENLRTKVDDDRALVPPSLTMKNPSSPLPPSLAP